DQNRINQDYENRGPQRQTYTTTLKDKLTDFYKGANGAGSSMRDLDLRGKTAQQIHDECMKRGAIFKRDTVAGTDQNGGEFTVFHDFYVLPDGGMVRVKCEGWPGNRNRSEPH